MKEFADYFFNGAEDPDRQFCLATCFRRAQEVNFTIRYLRSKWAQMHPRNYYEENLEKTLDKLKFERKYEHDAEYKAEKHYKMFKLQHGFEIAERIYDDLEIKFIYGRFEDQYESGPKHDCSSDCNTFVNGKNALLKEIEEMISWYRCALLTLLEGFTDLEEL